MFDYLEEGKEPHLAVDEVDEDVPSVGGAEVNPAHVRRLPTYLLKWFHQQEKEEHF